MANINVIFLHPTNMGKTEVELDDQMTGREVIDELLENDFMPNNTEGYKLAIKGGDEILLTSNLNASGVEEGTVLRIIPATNAGQDL